MDTSTPTEILNNLPEEVAVISSNNYSCTIYKNALNKIGRFSKKNVYIIYSHHLHSKKNRNSLSYQIQEEYTVMITSPKVITVTEHRTVFYVFL